MAISLQIFKILVRNLRGERQVLLLLYTYLAKSIAYVSFILLMLQILQNSCKELNNGIIYGYGKTA